MTPRESLQHFKVLTFDVVGTLIDFEGGMLAYLRQSGAAPASVSDEAILDAYRASRTAGKTLRYPDDLERAYFDLVRDCGLKDDRALARGFRDSAEFWPAFPDSVAALARLRTRYRLVAMTNAQRWALDHFARTLGSPFWDSITVDEALCEKPDPNFFGFARGRISRSGFVRDQILHVAQSQYHDIGVAKALGYTTCWIERRQGQRGFGGTIAVEALTKPDFHFSTLAGLADEAGL
ncbi:MAG: HAD-IA family hydrolase [Beijerinckiaceae bacterium]|nr:HAD-IA family hydrolase [Beijerinckiaceae bacterium]MCZ8301692.1 HAD-IA family hydrolase [Beijerinckiaceae bacterium]